MKVKNISDIDLEEELPPVCFQMSIEDEIKNLCLICLTQIVKDNNGKYFYHREIPNNIVKDKINNFIILVNNLNEQELEEFLDRDFEEDVFYTI